MKTVAESGRCGGDARRLIMATSMPAACDHGRDLETAGGRIARSPSAVIRASKRPYRTSVYQPMLELTCPIWAARADYSEPAFPSFFLASAHRVMAAVDRAGVYGSSQRTEVSEEDRDQDKVRKCAHEGCRSLFPACRK